MNITLEEVVKVTNTFIKGGGRTVALEHKEGNIGYEKKRFYRKLLKGGGLKSIHQKYQTINLILKITNKLINRELFFFQSSFSKFNTLFSCTNSIANWMN